MSIQSTVTISRKQALDRIKTIIKLAHSFNFQGIESASFETEESITDFVDYVDSIKHIEHLEKWTNKMLEELMDQPFFRKSIFENYYVA